MQAKPRAPGLRQGFHHSWPLAHCAVEQTGTRQVGASLWLASLLGSCIRAITTPSGAGSSKKLTGLDAEALASICRSEQPWVSHSAS